MHTKESLIGTDEGLSWTTVFSDLSGRCVRVETEHLDSALDETQRLVCDHLAVDHSELWQAYDEAEESLLLTHLHHRSDRSPEPRPKSAPGFFCTPGVERQDLPLRTDAKVFFPWMFSQARQGATVVVSNVAELPGEAARDREILIRDGIGSFVAVPLLMGGRWFGLLLFGMHGEARHWSELDVKACCMAGDVIATALGRIRTERALRESQLAVHLLGTGAGAEVWALDICSGEMKLGERGCGLLQLGVQQSCDFDKFLSYVHLEDREAVRAGVQRAAEAGIEVSLEYRVMAKETEVRWLSCRWYPVGTATGASSRLIGVAVEVTERKELQAELCRSAALIHDLKQRLKAESEYLKGEVKLNQRHTDVVGQSRGIRKVLQQVEQVAPVSCPVLISGESGTGKELIAQSIHRLSPRANRHMVTVNCAALPAGLIESELFGRERGAFTGALTSQAGRFEIADQSTIFLDEIAELSLELQSKLLRVLQEGEYARLGNPKTRKVDVRVIAATNRDLGEEVRKGRFREDLYYRLSVFPIHLPPLRERVEDIPLLVFAFLEELSSRMGKRITKVPRRVMEALERHYWPGNIRELRNAIERGVILSTGDTLRLALLANPQTATQQAVTLAEVERQHILAILEKTDWHIKGPRGAAKVLDLKPGTLYSRMRKLGVPHRRQKDGMTT